MTRKKILVSLVLLVLPITAAAASVTRMQDGWRLQSACELHADGAAISSPGYSVDGWLKTSVPATVLTAQTADKVFPDPY
ncbi:MAG: hypothetical protein WA476_05015, partial [Acidobacteriaceae bacterium]